MPITRARDNCTISADGIRFLMRDGSREVICQIALEALLHLTNATASSETIDIFERNREKIERAASHKYEWTTRQDYEIIIVTTADLASMPG